MLEVSSDANRAAPSVDSSAEVPWGDAERSPAAWIYGGFGIGIVMGFVITAVQWTRRGCTSSRSISSGT